MVGGWAGSPKSPAHPPGTLKDQEFRKTSEIERNGVAMWHFPRGEPGMSCSGTTTRRLGSPHPPTPSHTHPRQFFNSIAHQSLMNTTYMKHRVTHHAVGVTQTPVTGHTTCGWWRSARQERERESHVVPQRGPQHRSPRYRYLPSLPRGSFRRCRVESRSRPGDVVVAWSAC